MMAVSANKLFDDWSRVLIAKRKAESPRRDYAALLMGARC